MNLLFFLKPGLYVSKQTVINGNVTTDANGSVAGTIHGNVVTKATLVVENNGLITGNAYAKNVIVKGKINGDVHSEGKVDIIKDGEISGQIFATAVNAQEGSLKKGITKLTAANNNDQIEQTSSLGNTTPQTSEPQKEEEKPQSWF